MANVETIPDPDGSPIDKLAQYKEEIAYYEKESLAWTERGRKILNRYKDHRSPREMRVARFNILYSNVQTLLPAIYGKNPKADIERRFKDDDNLGRVTSDVLERTTDYFVNTEAFRSALRSALLDRLLPGRGTVWQRYVPHFRNADSGEPESPEEAELGPEISDDVEEAEQAELAAGEADAPLEEVFNEEVETDYVNWQDFGHNWGRTWDEIWLLWRKVFLSREELVERFGEDIAKMCPLDYYPKGLSDQKKETSIKKAVIYEMWDKDEKKVRWVHRDVAEFLDEKDDPLNLPDFFPCPKPLYAVLANDSMIPVPDYVEYQDQANELDELTSRIAALSKAVKAAGVYDASAEGVERLLAEGVENKLIPVKQWAVFGEKGGLKGVVDFLPLDDIMKALMGLYECREKVKADLYEITGIADILRGQGDANETATAQGIKSRFATLRLSENQDEMARFARDAVRNVGCLIANHFSIETIKKICGIKLLTNMEKMQLQMKVMQMMQPPPMLSHQPVMGGGTATLPPASMPQGVAGAPQEESGPAAAPQQQVIPHPMMQPTQSPQPNPNQIPDDVREQLDNPTWEEVEALLRDTPELSFKIDIEIDSTIKMDEEADQASRTQFLEASGKFLAAMQQAPAIAQPLLVQMLMFGVRGFRVGKEIEGAFQVFAEKVEKQAQNAPVNPPNPEMLKVQADIQAQQARSQADRQDAQADMQFKMQEQKQEFQFKMAELQQKYDLEIKKMQMDKDVELQKHMMTTQAQSKPMIQLDTGKMLDNVGNQIGGMADTLTKNHLANQEAVNKSLAVLANSMKELQKNSVKPKTITMQGRDGVMRTATVQ
ncbi:MAG: hypothetical protein ACH344_08705 [Yersinia sp. (in: enterobacteria)]